MLPNKVHLHKEGQSLDDTAYLACLTKKTQYTLPWGQTMSAHDILENQIKNKAHKGVPLGTPREMRRVAQKSGSGVCIILSDRKPNPTESVPCVLGIDIGF